MAYPFNQRFHCINRQFSEQLIGILDTVLVDFEYICKEQSEVAVVLVHEIRDEIKQLSETGLEPVSYLLLVGLICPCLVGVKYLIERRSNHSLEDHLPELIAE